MVPVDTAQLLNPEGNISSRSSIFSLPTYQLCASHAVNGGRTPISAVATAQPWIWVWNNQQKFDMNADDVHVALHPHQAEICGYSRFHVSMAAQPAKARLHRRCLGLTRCHCPRRLGCPGG
jgi:hypothetical protein